MARRRFPVFLLVLAACLAAAPARAARFEAVVTHVTDGDTLWVRPASGAAPRKLRLLGIDAPEICQAHGPQARDALAARALHRKVSVQSQGRDDYDRLLARVRLQGDDLGGWMVGQGHAWSSRSRRRAGAYAPQQAQARAEHRGLWARAGAVEPRVFRKRHGSCQPG